MRLIDADAFDKRLVRLGALSIKSALDEELTIEAEPVRHGRVIAHDGFEDEYYEYCSECKSRDVHIGDNYCPNCGCKMQGENNVLY